MSNRVPHSSENLTKIYTALACICKIIGLTSTLSLRLPKTVKKWMISRYLLTICGSVTQREKKPLLYIHVKYCVNDRCIPSVSLSLLALFCHSITRSRIPVARGRRYCADVYAIEVQCDGHMSHPTCTRLNLNLPVSCTFHGSNSKA